MKHAVLAQKVADHSLEAAPAVVTASVWLADVETAVVIFAGLCTAVYYAVSAWVRWRNRDYDRPRDS